MLLRALLRPISRVVVAAPKQINTFRPSPSAVAAQQQSPQDDQPIDMPNPFKKEIVQCLLCKHNIQPDYKNVKLLSQFQSPYTGRIYGRHITGLCKNMQIKVETEIKKAQNSGMMGYYHKNVTFLKDPKIFDPERPIRNHKY